MSRNRRYPILIAACFLAGCATNTSPTNVTINSPAEKPAAGGATAVGSSNDLAKVRESLSALRAELATLTAHLATLEAAEPAEWAVEETECVARPSSRDGLVTIPAAFEAECARKLPGKRDDERAVPITARQALENALAAHEAALAVIANNLANVNTVGFKADRANFEDLFYRQQVLPGVQDSSGQSTAVGVAIGLGSRVSSIQTDFSQGALQQTGRQLDLAIEGHGFFQVQDPSGETLYTRAGNFSINANGQLVVGSAATGRVLDPAITIPQDAVGIVVEPTGRVMVQQANNPQPQQIGQIQLARFINQEGLLKKGENLYAQSDASSHPCQVNPGCYGSGLIRQNILEASNVDPGAEQRRWRAAQAEVRRLRRMLSEVE